MPQRVFARLLQIEIPEKHDFVLVGRAIGVSLDPAEMTTLSHIEPAGADIVVRGLDLELPAAALLRPRSRPPEELSPDPSFPQPGADNGFTCGNASLLQDDMPSAWKALSGSATE